MRYRASIGQHRFPPCCREALFAGRARSSTKSASTVAELRPAHIAKPIRQTCSVDNLAAKDGVPIITKPRGVQLNGFQNGFRIL